MIRLQLFGINYRLGTENCTPKTESELIKINRAKTPTIN